MAESETDISSAAHRPPSVWSRVAGAYRQTSGWIATLLSVGVIVALGASFGPLQARASHLTSAPPKVRFTWPPLAGFSSAEVAGRPEPMTWVNAQIRSGLEQTVLGSLSSDPFDRDSLETAREDLARTGWFRDDLRLVREADGLVRVNGTWRIPAAAVRSGGQDVLVTSAGEVLPVRYPPEASGYKALIGVASPAPEPGQAWLGGEVQAGLRLLDYVSTLACAEQIAAVDVTDYGANRTLVLVTELGNRIIWGGPLDEFNPGQAAPAAKLARLGEIYRQHGRVDAGRAVLDVRLLDGVYVRDTTGVMARSRQNPPDAKKGDRARAKKPGSR
ncbi:MAG TPA: hypothetical protein PKE29_13655 [Phycisphaerales bacterium]|nr:hypothetical protein [Phycisphaerales bacterium]